MHKTSLFSHHGKTEPLVYWNFKNKSKSTENWGPQLQFVTGRGVIEGCVCSCDCRWLSLAPLRGGLRFEPFCEWGGHGAKEQDLLQLSTEAVEENLYQQELQRQLAAKSKGFGIRRGETSWGSNPQAWVELCPDFSQVWERGSKEAKCNGLHVWWYSVDPLANIVFSFLISPVWNHRLVVCCVISFSAERRQVNFLLDGLKGSVLYSIWVTRTMSDQSAVKWKKVTAQPEQDKFSHLPRGKGQA